MNKKEKNKHKIHFNCRKNEFSKIEDKNHHGHKDNLVMIIGWYAYYIVPKCYRNNQAKFNIDRIILTCRN